MEAIDEKSLIKIQITKLLKFADAFKGVEVHVFIGGKFLKMNYAEDQFIDILRKLQQKELSEVYINQTDCSRLLGGVQQKMSAKSFYDPSTTDEQRMELAESSATTVKQIINQIGVDKLTMEIIRDVNSRALSMVAESPTIHAFVKRFRKNCTEEFLQAVLTSYLTTMVIDKFPWRSVSVKEKAGYAAMFCDMTLDQSDFLELQAFSDESGIVSEKIRNHPKEVANILSLKKNLVPAETITIIEQHHERPDGKGYPYGIQLARFNQLSSIFIVCQRFTEGLFRANFDYKKRLDVLGEIHRTYNGRTFDKALEALISIVSA